jgi:fatty acid desaturase
MTKFDEEVAEIIKIAANYRKYPTAKYWMDFGLSISLGWILFFVKYYSNNPLVGNTALFISILAFYRAITFTHEVVHLREKDVPGFRFAWSIFCGIPLLAPHFLYHDLHLNHHSKKKYNTKNDVEYFPFYGNPSSINIYYFKNLILPVMSIFRFLILPLTILLGGEIREKICQNASSMGIRLIFEREPVVNDREKKLWLFEEIASFFYVWFIAFLIYIEILTFWFVIQWAIVIIGILTLNTYRFFSATHIYSGNGEVMSFEKHILDSVNIKDTGLFSKLIAPVGQSFHGLHHIVPSIPGLRLHEVHNEIIGKISRDHFYHKINYENFKTVYEKVKSGS